MNGCGSSWFKGPFPHVPASEPGGRFGSLAAIAPHFDAMGLAEQKAAVNLVIEAGERLPAIAARLSRDLATIEAIRDVFCRPVPPAAEPDAAGGRTISGLLSRPVPKAVYDRAIDEALAAIDAHRAGAGAGRDDRFEMTVEALCQACGFGIETARRRLKELESRKWVRRELRPGRPPLMLIALAGRCRLDALGRRGAP